MKRYSVCANSCCCRPMLGQKISVDFCSSGVWRANVGSATLSAYVRGAVGWGCGVWRPPLFSTVVSPTPHFLLMKFLQKLVHCCNWLLTETHTHPFNGPFSRTIRVSRYQKGKTNLDFTEARDSEWQWHQLGHMQVCLLQTDNHASTPTLSIFTRRMPFLPPNQQRQSTEG